jgi:endonuclease/exonuclease/phosphatase family metal-dependent hydrolase
VADLVIATFNVHAGVDGWGRPYDVVEACAALDADVLFLQENWMPEAGDSIACLVGAACGYEVHEARLCDAMIFDPIAQPGRRWGPSRRDHRSGRPLWVTDSETLGRVRAHRRGEGVRLGAWGIAALFRVPQRRLEIVELGRLSHDNRRLRAVLVAEVDLDGSPLTVAGTHLAHFMHGSPVLMNKLRRILPGPERPAVLVGDMNFWGPPVSLALPGWRRAVRARTYASWRPHSQIDHILVTRPVSVISSGAVHVGRSDHWPVRARLGLAERPRPRRTRM